MMIRFWMLFMLTYCLHFPCLVQAENVFVQRLDTIPASVNGLLPRVRLFVDRAGDQEPSWLLISLRASQSPVTTFNPFGVEDFGRAYSLELADCEGRRIATLLDTQRSEDSLPPSCAWVDVPTGGVVGVFHRMPRLPFSIRADDAGTIPAGKYQLYVVFRSRALMSCPFEGNKEQRRQMQALWSDTTLDELCFRSALVDIELTTSRRWLMKESGFVKPVGHFTVFPEVADNQRIRFEILLLPAKQRWAANPFFRSALGKSPVHIELHDVNGQSLMMGFNHRGSGPLIRTVDDCVLVPPGGVIGDFREMEGEIPVGVDSATITVDQSAWIDSIEINRDAATPTPMTINVPVTHK